MNPSVDDAGNGARDRILVCDDERHIARLLQVNFEKQGFEVTLAYDGEQAIEQLQEQDFDRVVIDLMMPRKDGYEVLKWIRTNERTEKIWVALMTGNAKGWNTGKEVPYQADLYIEKPFDPAKLLA